MFGISGLFLTSNPSYDSETDANGDKKSINRVLSAEDTTLSLAERRIALLFVSQNLWFNGLND